MTIENENKIVSITDLISAYLKRSGARDEYAEDVAESTASEMGRFFDFKEKVESDHLNDYGIALEYWDANNKCWKPSEIAVSARVLFGNEEPYRWKYYTEAEMDVGMFANHGDAWWMEGDDWGFRLGVQEPMPTDDEPVYGFSTGGCNDEGTPYRLRRVAVGPIAEDKRKWLLENFG